MASPIVGRLRKASWIYTGTVSKTLLPGLRVGYLIASPDLYPYLLRLKQSADLHTNRIGQWQALQWLGSAAYADHLAALRSFYRERRDAMQAALQEHFSELANWGVPQGGLNWSNWSGHPGKPHTGGIGGVHDQEDATSVLRRIQG
jgi:DNA-binding transcriptional MocR family regulator